MALFAAKEITSDTLPGLPVSTTVSVKPPKVAKPRNVWKLAFLGLIVILALAGMGKVTWDHYWLERWQSAQLYDLHQQQQVVITFLQKQINEGRLK